MFGVSTMIVPAGSLVRYSTIWRRKRAGISARVSVASSCAIGAVCIGAGAVWSGPNRKNWLAEAGMVVAAMSVAIAAAVLRIDVHGRTPSILPFVAQAAGWFKSS